MRIVPTIYYKPIHFALHELVPKPVLDELSERAWRLFDPRVLYTADCIHEEFGGPICCNTWYWGGPSQFRGYRPRTFTQCSAFSMHYGGGALDLIKPGMDPVHLQLKIIEKNRLFPYISRIEKIPTHLHFDCANVPGESINHFNP